jgi:predicted amidohydrolase
MTPVLADVAQNLADAERLVRRAAAQGAELVALPEFFTSAMAFHPAIPDAVEPFDGRPLQTLRHLAASTGATIGGSFLAWRDGDVYNTFTVATPDGAVFRHDKDAPTFVENCYYRSGSDDGILNDAPPRLGAALCWELIRTRTAVRLLDRADLVIGGSCWWQRSDRNPAVNLAVLENAPRTLARLLGVPVVHASHAGSFEGGTVTTRDFAKRAFHYLGETQIVDGDGTVLARLSAADGEGIIAADVVAAVRRSERLPVPARFWIPAMPDGWDEAWRTSLRRDHEYYLEHARPRVAARLGGGGRR